jgi:hypothetical protein
MSEELDPTQPGGTPVVNIAQNARMQAMAEISEKAYAEVAPDLADIDEELGTVIPRVKAEPDMVAPTIENDTPPPGVAPTPIEVVLPKRMVPIVSEGQTIEVPEDRVFDAGRRTLQKEYTADRRLQEATELKRRYEHALSQLSRPSSDAANSQRAPSSDAPISQQAAIDPDDRPMTRRELKNELYVSKATDAAAQFRKDYADIVSDPYLYDMAVQLENKRLAEATALGESFGDPFDAYRKHGEALREWKAKLTGTVAAPVDKLERKRTIAAVPGNNATPPKPEAEVEKTPSQIIDDMRKDRARGYTFRAPRNGHKYG